MSNRNKVGLVTDERGAVAFEMPFVALFIMLSLILPTADFAVFGYDSISAYQALRDAGQYLQYHPPSDVTASYMLPASVATIHGFKISTPTLTCGTATCSSNPAALPKYYTFTTSFTLTPSLVMKPVLCPTSCKYTLTYSERFQ